MRVCERLPRRAIREHFDKALTRRRVDDKKAIMLHFFFFSLLIHFEEKQPMYHHTIFESMIRI